MGCRAWVSFVHGRLELRSVAGNLHEKVVLKTCWWTILVVSRRRVWPWSRGPHPIWQITSDPTKSAPRSSSAPENNMTSSKNRALGDAGNKRSKRARCSNAAGPRFSFAARLLKRGLIRGERVSCGCAHHVHDSHAGSKMNQRCVHMSCQAKRCTRSLPLCWRWKRMLGRLSSAPRDARPQLPPALRTKYGSCIRHAVRARGRWCTRGVEGDVRGALDQKGNLSARTDE